MQKCVLEKVISGKVGLIDLLVLSDVTLKYSNTTCTIYTLYIDKSRHGYRKIE